MPPAYKQTENMPPTTAALTEGAYMAGVDRRQDDQEQHAGRSGSIPIPEVIRNINSFTLARRASTRM